MRYFNEGGDSSLQNYYLFNLELFFTVRGS